MFILKLIGKALVLPVVLILGILRLLVKLAMEVSSFILGAAILIVFGCIIFTVIKHDWRSLLILMGTEVFLVLITAGTGVIEAILEMASESLRDFLRS